MGTSKKKYFLAFILISILASLLVRNAYAQTPTPPTRDQLIAEIKEYADRHAKTNTPMQTQLVVDLFRNNTVGLSSQEIATIYEEEYTQFLETQKPSPWEQLKPNIGWIVAIILLVVLALGDVFKKKVTDLFTNLWDSIYKHLAGSRIFRSIALTHYQKSLVNKYQKLKVPFRPERPLDMRNVYVPLQASGSNDNLQLDAYKALVDNRKLMIVGQPGSGKSMLLKHIALTYADNRLNEFPEYPIPVLIELHRLNDAKLTLNQLLVDEFDRNDFPNANYFVSTNLETGTLLLLFDGLDEVSSSERKRVAQLVSDFVEKYKECRFIVTCRTAVYKHEFDTLVDKTLEIVEFTDQQIRGFLKSWEPEMTRRNKSIEQLMLTLRDRPKIMQIARNPLMLTIITYLYTDVEFILPNSRAEFYRKATDILLDLWHQEHNKFRSSDKRQVLQHLALFSQDQSQGQDNRKSMEAHDVLEQVNNLLPQLNLQVGQDARPLIDEIVERSGLLLSIDSGEKYQFAHLTLQEYFAAAELKDDSVGLSQRFTEDKDSWREAVKLWCGLDIDSTTLLKRVYEIDPITAFESLADVQKVDQSLAEAIIRAFEDRFADEGQNDLIVRAFAAVASDTRPRGVSVTKFLETMLSQNNELSRKAAATALSLTNLPQAAGILASQYSEDVVIRKSLIRMGDLAVPTLASLSTQGNTNAICDLQQIGTPQASEKITNLLWGANDEICILSAWCITTLLHNPTIENSLRDYKLPSQSKNGQQIDWIWEPFSESQNSSIPIIAGRTAYLLIQTPDNFPIPDTLLDLDPRVVIPICVILKPPKNFGVSLQIEEALKSDNPDNPIIKTLQRFPSFNEHEKEIFPLKDKFASNTWRDLSKLNDQIMKYMNSPEMPPKTLFETFKVLFQENLPRVSIDLVQRLSDSFQKTLIMFLAKTQRIRPERKDWINIFNPIKYDLEKSLHLKIIWLVEIFLSVITVFLLSANVKNAISIWDKSSLLSLAGILIIAIGWLIVWNPFDWSTFILIMFDSPQGAILAGPFSIVIMIYLLFTQFDMDSIVELVKSLVVAAWISLVWYVVSIGILFSFSWVYVAVFWLLIYIICIGFWIRGKNLQRIASNPLKGLVDHQPENKNRQSRWKLKLFSGRRITRH